MSSRKAPTFNLPGRGGPGPASLQPLQQARQRQIQDVFGIRLDEVLPVMVEHRLEQTGFRPGLSFGHDRAPDGGVDDLAGCRDPCGLSARAKLCRVFLE